MKHTLIIFFLLIFASCSVADPYTPVMFWSDYSEFVITHDNEVDTVIAADYVTWERRSGQTIIVFCANTRDVERFKATEFSIDTLCSGCYSPVNE